MEDEPIPEEEIGLPKLNTERMSERLRKAAEAAERLGRAAKIIEDASKKNPNGLPF